ASDWTPSLSVFRRALLHALAENGFEAQPFADGPRMRVVEIEQVKNEFFKACHVGRETEGGRPGARAKHCTRKVPDDQQRVLMGGQVAGDRSLVWLVDVRGSGADPAGRTFSIH